MAAALRKRLPKPPDCSAKRRSSSWSGKAARNQDDVRATRLADIAAEFVVRSARAPSRAIADAIELDILQRVRFERAIIVIKSTKGQSLMTIKLHHSIPFLHRLYTARDKARAERDDLALTLLRKNQREVELVAEVDRYKAEVDQYKSEVDRYKAERDNLLKSLSDPRSYGTEVTHRQFPSIGFGRTQPPPDVEDGDLVPRIISAFRLSIDRRSSVQSVGPQPESMWDRSLVDMRRDADEIMRRGDEEEVRRLLRDPGKTNLCFGFENLALALHTDKPGNESFCIKVYQDLLLLAEAIGVKRTWNPENAQAGEPLPSVDDLLSLLDKEFGHTIVVPNPFPGEVGLATSRGVITDRTVQALFQAWRINKLMNGDREARLLEIGAGLGRTAFYAAQFGFHNYTIVDLPLTSVAQGYFLGRTLGPNAVRPFGEGTQTGVSIIPPEEFFDREEKYDLAINVDSLTEIDLKTATSYFTNLRRRVDIFLSINHEANSFTVRQVGESIGLSAASRNPYWMRPGYVEEIFRFAERV
jgi:hypothetical protein